jgi:phenylalanyl-tRNA synthetase beta chain
MKVSLNWLKEFVELPVVTADLTQLLTLAGVEVEGVETHGVLIDNVVVAQILESAQHPNADRLSVCRVDDGSGEIRQIVCGAKNYAVGDKVPLARPGAVLPDDFKIKVGKLRGVESQGMLCSGKELGISDNAEGLLILPQTARVGAPLSELYPADTILDLEITPNRADLLSYAGIAREVAALTGRVSSFSAPQSPPPRVDGSVVIEAPSECPFYSARKISGVKVGSSPDWLKQKIEASGVRSINNIVDITNFVLLETGQPLHAFDADKLQGGLHARLAGENEELLTLDGRAYKLTSQNLVIADSQRAVAIAGVMGGEETGVTESTVNVILESAYFLPSNIRRTARDLGLISDSSYRFERGVDPGGVLSASQRATDLILELAGGTATPAPDSAGAVPDFRRSITLRKGRCAKLLGTEVPGSFIGETLTRFGLATQGDHTWDVPSFRQDLTREIDLVEEITRVFGIDNIPAREMGRYAASTATDAFHDRNMQLRRLLVAQGFYEARTLSLVGESAACCPCNVLRVRNPLAQDQVVLRPALLGGLFDVAAGNARAGAKSLRLFELGRIFRTEAPEERTHLALLMTGAVALKSWRAAVERDADIFDLKGVLASLGLGELVFEQAENPHFALSASISMNGKPVGFAGQIWPAKAREMDITTPIIAAEIEIPAPQIALEKFEVIAKYPAVTRDMAFVAPESVRHTEVEEVLRKSNEPLLAGLELFDVFTDPTGQKISSGSKSMAYSLTYRDKTRTLNAEEVNVAHARLKERLKAELNVTFRE